jgi:molybdate transport repressor ModE-like protein
MRARLRIRVDFDEGTILSPGKVRLFELIDECGSLEGAAATLQMDRDHARHVIARLEHLFGGPLVVVGSDGRSKLSDLGKMVIVRYHAAERISAEAAERALNELVSLAPGKGAIDANSA